MTEAQPPLAITLDSAGAPTEHDAASFRRLVELLAGGVEGVRAAGDLAVTANGTPNLTVHVAAGEALILGTQQPAAQGMYSVFNDASVTLTIAAQHATNDRKDLIVARVYDRDYAGTDGEWALEVVQGTPAGSPVDPATPDNSLVLARVLVKSTSNGGGTVVTGDITDLRVRASANGPQLAPHLFSGGISNGTATTFTEFLTQNTILVAPIDLTMIVEVAVNLGFSGAPNRTELQVRDESGASINFKSGGSGDWKFDIDTGAKWYGGALIGKKDYSAGQTCGFRLAYLLSTSNVYIDAAVKVTFVPR